MTRNSTRTPPADNVNGAILTRNIRNSQLIIAGDFESVVADLIVQFEHPPKKSHHPMPAPELAKRIAHSLRQGFAGLHPNGFDFATWLWDVAPLHSIDIPLANEIGRLFGFRYGIAHLRKIAAIIADLYLTHQPQKAGDVVSLIDSSTDYIDARNLIFHALTDFYSERFDQEFDELVALSGSDRHWRRLIPLGIAANAIRNHPAHTEGALILLQQALSGTPDENIRKAVAFVVRTIFLSCNGELVIPFIERVAPTTHETFRTIICEEFRRKRTLFTPDARHRLRTLLQQWCP